MKKYAKNNVFINKKGGSTAFLYGLLKFN